MSPPPEPSASACHWKEKTVKDTKVFRSAQAREPSPRHDLMKYFREVTLPQMAGYDEHNGKFLHQWRAATLCPPPPPLRHADGHRLAWVQGTVSFHCGFQSACLLGPSRGTTRVYMTYGPSSAPWLACGGNELRPLNLHFWEVAPKPWDRPMEIGEIPTGETGIA
jgi:hypothetical protein